MLGRGAFVPLAVCMLAGVPASAGPDPPTIDLRSQPLPSALQELARRTGAELLFDRSLVSGRQAPHVHGHYDFQAALEQLLSGTGLTFRRAASGAWLIERAAVPRSEELAAPEILIVGKRTQNFDIRRRENDIQPYAVTPGVSIARAHTDNVDEYFRSRVTANTEFVSPTLLTDGATNSEIDLRGLGAGATLVLIDGRRMPGLPSNPLAFGQPDLNAIPIHSIDRIETLTGTAGGIFGFGALGGVVNVILKRDYRGAELSLIGGVSSRGDAHHLGIEGRAGFTPDGGRTDVMLYLSHAWAQPLLVGQRDFTIRNLTENFRRAGQLVGATFPNGNSVGVTSAFGGNLTFKPQFGGGALASDHSFLPIGFSGGTPDLVAALTRNAGQTDLSLTPGDRDTMLDSNPNVSAAILNVRHRFSDNIEGYLDGLLFQNHGRYVDHVADGAALLDINAPGNPFNQEILVHFPMPGERDSRINVDSERYTAGMIVELPRHWRGTAEETFGAAHYDAVESLLGTNLPFPLPTNLNPLGNWTDFQQALVALKASEAITGHPTNHYQEQLLQFAGPLARTAAGPAILTVSLEHHRENVGAFVVAGTSDVFGSSSAVTPAHSSTTESAHAELNAKLFSEAAPFFLLKGLELQIAAHFDSERVVFRTDPAKPEESLFHTTFTGMAYTAGTKVQPSPWLMLRGSFATGRQPPPLVDLISRSTNFTSATDPRRGNAFVFTEGDVTIKTGGSPSLSALHASTLSLGTVITPLRNLRFSLDYSRIRKTHDVTFFTDPQVILDHETSFPERVTRAPLTDQDKALGYIGGLITGMDVTAANGSGVHVDTLDARLDWTVPLLGGKLHSYGSATWQMHNVQQGLFGPTVERVNFLGGPLKWRANGGVDWGRGRLTLGANLQFFGRYRVFSDPVLEGLFKALQGSDWVPSQAYLDLYAGRRIELGGKVGRRLLNIDLGVNNVLDASPPREANFGLGDPGYSRFGDPRRRRFELAVTASF